MDSPRTEGFPESPRRGVFGDSHRAAAFEVGPRRGALEDSPRRGAFTDSLHVGLAADSHRARQSDSSPQGRSHSVPEWLNSPRSSSANSKHLTPDSSFGGGGLLGPPPGRHSHRASESTSPGAIHRMNVFDYPGSSGVSSEPSAEAVASQLPSEHQPETHSQDPHFLQSSQAGALPTPMPSQVSHSKRCFVNAFCF